MQRCVAALLALGLASGCTTKNGGKIGTLAGVGILSIGFALQAGAFGPGGETDPEDVAFIPLTIGALIAIPSLYVYVTARDEDDAAKAPPVPPRDSQVEKRAVERERAWQLTKQAMEAARGGDCATTARLGSEVQALDADFYESVFVRDAANARCLTPPAASSTAPD
ncbi:MAG: hypothetical protein H0T46_05275 [Deltaproteobacteria bacterium]|nr:hypothetical protein [Deltaproteobacteria bacterium]